MILVDDAAEALSAPDLGVERDDDRVVVVGWPVAAAMALVVAVVMLVVRSPGTGPERSTSVAPQASTSPEPAPSPAELSPTDAPPPPAPTEDPGSTTVSQPAPWTPSAPASHKATTGSTTITIGSRATSSGK